MNNKTYLLVIIQREFNPNLENSDSNLMTKSDTSTDDVKKDRVCKTIATVALIDTRHVH